MIFIPCTPSGHLRKLYESEIRKTDFKIKVIERAGTKIKDMLHRKDPFKRNNCGRPDCFVCTSDGRGQKICDKENVTYRIQCKEDCKKRDIYKGETSYSAYTRGLEHIKKYQENDPNSMLQNHSQSVHQGNRIEFQMDILGTYHRDATLRQISEGIEIEKTPPARLMNTRSEWNSSLIPQCTVQRR